MAYINGKQVFFGVLNIGTGIDESKVIEATASGVGYVGIDDISEIPHNVSVQLTSDTITDFSTVKVKRYTTNLFCEIGKRTVKEVPYQNETLRQWDGKSIVLGLGNSNGTYEAAIRDFSMDTKNNSITFTSTSTAYGVAFDVLCVPNVQQSFVFESEAQFRLIYLAYDEAGNVLYKNVSIIRNHGTFIPPVDAKWFVLSFAPTDNYVNTPITIKMVRSYFTYFSPQHPREYTPYEEVEYAPNAEGLVKDITATAPDMIFIPDKKCEINVNYRKSWTVDRWDKDFWEQVQQGGSRASYYNAFNGTSGMVDKFYNPIYPIKGQCQQIFADSFVTDTKVPIIATGNINHAFSNSKIKVIRSLDITSFTGTVTAIFNNCKNLEELNVTGTIQVNGFDVSASTNLTHASIMSIINALTDKTSESGFTVTLGATNLQKLTDDEKAIATQKGWTLA